LASKFKMTSTLLLCRHMKVLYKISRKSDDGRTNSTLSDFNDISYVGRLWCPEMIPDIEKFLPVAIFKMATTIPHKFNIVRYQRPEFIPLHRKISCWICAVLWWPFWKWRPVEIFQCRESIRDIIIYSHIKFWWYRTMLNFGGIVVAILKMATGRNFSMSAINSGYHYLPTYQILNFYLPYFMPCFV
jgi:hypothetical protein